MGDAMFKKMEYVLTVHKEKSFTKAAEKLYISQPCLSAAIKKLEEEIGMPLFERRYSSVKPTKIGAEYIKAAEQITNIQQGFLDILKETDSMQFGSITVGGTNYVSSYILPCIISEFSKLYPKIEIFLVESKSTELEKMLESEEIDLFIDSFDIGTSSQDCYPLLKEKIMLAVPKSFECNMGLDKYQVSTKEIINSSHVPDISVEKFKNEKFILLKNGNNMYKHAMKIFEKANINPEVSYRLDQLSTSLSLAASECGVCFVTDTVFKYHKFFDDIVLYNLKENTTRTLYVAKKKNRFFSHAMEKFIDVTKECIK